MLRFEVLSLKLLGTLLNLGLRIKSTSCHHGFVVSVVLHGRLKASVFGLHRTQHSVVPVPRIEGHRSRRSLENALVSVDRRQLGLLDIAFVRRNSDAL